MLEVTCDADIGPLHLQAGFQVTQAWTVLFGPSGSGKSSLLRLIAGLWRPEGSRVIVDDCDLTPIAIHRRHIGLVAQDPALFPHMTARENISFVLAMRKTAGSTTKEREVDALLRRVRLPNAADQMPGQLSGGEVKRVALARAMASAPRLLLLDEVFTGMDAALAEELRADLRGWQRETGVPILSVTHDVAEALASDEVVRVHNGHVTAQGSPVDVLREERQRLLNTLTAPMQ